MKVYVRTVDGQIHADRHRGCRLILEFWLVDEGHPPKRRATQPNLFRRYALDPGRRDLPKPSLKADCEAGEDAVLANEFEARSRNIADKAVLFHVFSHVFHNNALESMRNQQKHSVV